MKFNVEKLKEVSRPMNEGEIKGMEERENNRDWLALSAKFALAVRRILRTENMTQKELATRMGVSSVQVTKLLSGKENIGLQTIAKVEKALGKEVISFEYRKRDEVRPPLLFPYSIFFYNWNSKAQITGNFMPMNPFVNDIKDFE